MDVADIESDIAKLSYRDDYPIGNSKSSTDEYKDTTSDEDQFELVYTEKEKALHIIGPQSKLPLFPTFPVSSDYIPASDINDFIRQGYFLAKFSVEKRLLYEAREYIDANYRKWLLMSKRQDDWRIHYQADLSNENGMIDHEPIMNLILKTDSILKYVTCLMGTQPAGIFYTQLAFRTPTKKITKPFEDYQDGAEYHLDGNANMYGIRFPDPWTVMVGIALVNIDCEEKGNFTVFPGYHTARDWSLYPTEKQNKSLPNLGEATRISLKAGEAVFVHVLLPHRGGRNTLDKSIDEGSASVGDGDEYEYAAKNIPINTREMVFFRFRGEGVTYESSSRGRAVLREPWLEYPFIQHIVQNASTTYA